MSEKQETILVIDDEELLRTMISTFLRRRNFIPVTAANGMLGLQEFDRLVPDLVLVDLRMPEMNGLDFLTGLREKSSETPVIVISATEHLSDVVEALRRGAWDFIIKPIDLTLLEHAIQKSLERARLLRENARYRLFLEEEVRKRTEELDRELQTRIAAQNALRESLDVIEGAMKSFILAMTRIVETRDPYTAGHQQRVSQMACTIAEEMGMAAEQVDTIRWASLIHDIGKISVPAELLNKPGRLSEIEFNIIKTHPVIGYNILSPIEFPWPLAETVFQHHEKMDGSGYPRGLLGNEIMPEARIIRLADVVEAMSAHRPYRPRLSTDQIILDLQQERGTSFETQVVDVCLKLISDKRLDLE